MSNKEATGRARKKGETGVAKDARVKEVARLLVFGFSVAQIADRFGVTKVSASNYIKEAEEKGYVQEFSDKRDSEVGIILSQNMGILGDTTEILKGLVEGWKDEMQKPVDERDVKKIPSASTVLAVAGHAAKITGTVKDEEKDGVNVDKLQQNIIFLNGEKKNLMKELGLVE